MWKRVAPILARSFTVVATDLRGYGDSDKPPTDARHAPYSKRALAADQVLAMRSLCFDRFFLAAHDRGARVAHRLTLDHPDAVERLALLNIAPTLDMYEGTDLGFAISYYHWFLLISLAVCPSGCSAQSQSSSCATNSDRPAAEGRIRPFSLPLRWRNISAASPTLRPSMRRAKSTAPVLRSIWNTIARRSMKNESATAGIVGSARDHRAVFDPLTLWRARASAVQGEALPCGH